MQARRVHFTFTVLLSLLASLSFADGTRVGVFFPPTAAAGGVQRGTGSGPSIEDLRTVLSYYLGISDSCVAIEFDTDIGDATEERLMKAAEEFNLDSVIYLTDPTALNLYTVASGRTERLSFADTDLTGGAHTAVHRLLAPFLDDLLDISDSWGTVELNPRGAGGDYAVEIDEIFAGDDIGLPVAVPAGSHVVTAVQNRPFGKQILMEERVAVQRGAKKSLSFAVPELTDLERTAFDAIDTRILAAWDTDKRAVKDQFDILETLFTGVRSSLTVERYKEKYSTWQREFSAGQTASKITISAPVEIAKREEIAAEIEKDLDLRGAGLGRTQTVEGDVLLDQAHAAPGFGNVLLASIGPLFERAGGVVNALAYDKILTGENGDAAAFSYSNLTYDLSGEDGVYFWTALGLWGGAGLAKPLLFPYPRYNLSPGGKVVYAAGTILDTAGDLLTFVSRVAGASRARAEDTLAAGPAAVPSGDPETYKTVQLITGYSGYGAWALGTTASFVAPYIAGERSAAVSGGFQKILYSAGSLFNVLGNLTSIIAYNARLLVDIRSTAYELDEFPSGTSRSYEMYETAYKLYLGSTIAAYSLWGLGAATSILAVALPDRQTTAAGRGLDRTRPEPLFYLMPKIQPDYAGVTLWF